MIDAETVLADARRPLVIGIGGGGDVVGALATAETCRLYHGAAPMVGGTTWERRVIDPHPGPRAISEIQGGEPLSDCVVLADESTGADGITFSESHMARFLGGRTVIVDPHPGPAGVADGIGVAADALHADLIVFLDVGGDALAHGDEPGLASPLCDAVLLAAAARLQDSGRSVLAAIFGAGCDAELTPAEVLDRLSEVAAAGGWGGARSLTPVIAERLRAAIEEVPTEASAMAVRCFEGATGTGTIRRGLRHVPLSPLGALTFYLDVRTTVNSAARLAKAVIDAGSLEDANDVLHSLGVRSELDLERESASRPA